MIRGNRQSALVLFSGGQDSTVCLYWALQHFVHVEAVCFKYGQRHEIEVEIAQRIAQKANVPLRIIHAEMISRLSDNALTNPLTIMDREQTTDEPPNTFVPGRNLLFLSIAAIVAREKHIFDLVTGVSQTDFSGYPDCRESFIKSLNTTLNLAMDEEFVIHTPLMWKNKKDVWQLANELGIFDLVKNETITCYNGIPAAGCGECPACLLRNNGLIQFEEERKILNKKDIIQ
ncbi:MAG: 7-cyano-7-deazaguanine synthase QueC [Tannerella sp.]|jgi:7-cyano-7-deazaguanine synthase|nr:7-cyano-7-deazaguanine synthase QueC [Tannerella sp.]